MLKAKFPIGNCRSPIHLGFKLNGQNSWYSGIYKLTLELASQGIKSVAGIADIKDIPLRILVGHKGIGKSALFKIAMSEDRSVNRRQWAR